MIIDAHCHVWPNDIAASVVASDPVGLKAMHDGTLDGLIRTMDDAGIDRAMCLGVATVARTVNKTNEFIGSVDRRRFIPFGTVHPDLSVEENLRSLKENGIIGVKLHPLFQEFDFSSARVIELLHAMAESGLVVIAHAGSGGNESENERGSPRQLARAIEAVPELRFIACHFGGYQCLDEAERFLVGSTAFLETSWPPRLSDLDQVRVLEILRRHGISRIVFGSDWPMADPANEIATIRSLALDPAEEEGILGGNLARLLQISG